MQAKNKLILNFAFAVYLILLCWLIIFKCNSIVGDLFFGFRSINFIPYNSPKQALDYVLNIVAYLPFGVFLSLIFNKKSLFFKILIIALSSVLFESFQYAFAFGSADISDVISNTLGGILGIIIFALTKKILTQKVVFAVSLGVILVGLPLVVFAIISTVTVFPQYFL